MPKIIKYGRGFLGYDNDNLDFNTGALDIKSQVASLKYQKPTKESKKFGIYNEAVDKLYNQLITGQKDLTSFSFRRAILSEAFRAFNTFSFYNWCKLQEGYSLGKFHKEFLNDTFRFILTGTRENGLRAYEFVLKPAKADLTDINTKYKYQEFFNAFAETGKDLNYSTSFILKEWVSHPKGFEDLLCTLHLIFGKYEITS